MTESEDITPFEYLQTIDRTCIENQGGIVQQKSDIGFSHGLAFQLGSHKYIIPIADVSEVLSVKDLTHIPRSPSWLVGIANVRGNLITLIDIHVLIFGTSAKGSIDNKRLLLVKQEAHHYGLMVDAIIGMKSFNAERGIEEVPEGFDYEHVDHISAFYSSGDEWFAALSISSLLQDEHFAQLQKLA